MSIFRYRRRSLPREALMILVAILWAIPFYFLIVVALKPADELSTSSPVSLPSRLEFSNFAEAWQGSGGVSLGQALLNSAIITVGSVVALIVLGSLCAYAVGRRSDRTGTVLYALFVFGIILPVQLAIVPIYYALRELNLVGSYLGTILLYTGLELPLTVFLYVGFVRTLPRDYEEAAFVDGATRLRTFVRVVFPLLRPVTATVAVLTGLIVWNDFFIQLIFLSGGEQQTLPVAVYGFVGEYLSQWNLIFAALIVAMAPILIFYLFAQRQLIRGFTGGIKS